jgi:hypothetical protein
VLVGIIIACEIGFWVLLFAGLVARYLLRWPRIGAALLVGVPLVDLVLLGATVLDLRRGAVADWSHGLAAVYLGFSIAFGHGLITRTDAWFAHRYAGGPAPKPRPRYGAARARHEGREFAKAALAAGIASGLLGAGVLVVGDPIRTAALVGWIRNVGLVLGVWAAIAASYSISPRWAAGGNGSAQEREAAAVGPGAGRPAAAERDDQPNRGPVDG